MTTRDSLTCLAYPCQGAATPSALGAAEFDEAVEHDPLQLFLEAEDEPELVVGYCAATARQAAMTGANTGATSRMPGRPRGGRSPAGDAGVPLPADESGLFQAVKTR